MEYKEKKFFFDSERFTFVGRKCLMAGFLRICHLALDSDTALLTSKGVYLLIDDKPYTFFWWGESGKEELYVTIDGINFRLKAIRAFRLLKKAEKALLKEEYERSPLQWPKFFDVILPSEEIENPKEEEKWLEVSNLNEFRNVKAYLAFKNYQRQKDEYELVS